MKKAACLAIAMSAFTLWLPGEASAQVVGFSRQQQAALYAYTTQLQAQQRAQFQQQFQQLNQQLLYQQRAIQVQQFQDAALLDYLNATNGTLPNNVVPRVTGGNRAASAFGTVHYVSPYYMRVQPYYDYGFVRSRNRQLSPAASTTITGY